MRIRDFEYLIALEKAKTINKAAKSVFISQQGFSRILDSIESELGERIVERTRSGVTFTPAGKALLSHARTIVQEYHRALDDLTEIRLKDKREEIDVTISSYIALVLYEKTMQDLDFDASIVYREQRLDAIFQEMRQGETDRLYLLDWIGSSPIESADFCGDWKTVEVTASRMGVLTSSAHAAESISCKELERRPLISFSGDDYFRNVGHILDLLSSKNIVMSLTNMKAIRARLRESDGALSITDHLSFSLKEGDDDGLAFVPIEPAEHLIVAFAYRADSERRLAYERYIETWRNAFLNACRTRLE